MFQIDKKQKGGFTLIELLVVVAIIGVLSSVILASLNAARAKARDARRISDFEQIRTALNLYASDNSGSFPSAGGYYTSWSGCGSSDWQTLATILHPYISTLPLDPSGHAAGCPAPDAYWYAYLPNFHSGSISSGDGAEGTCLGKTILFLDSTEGGGIKKQDCQFVDISGLALKTGWYPNAIIIVIN
jgi:prepilin-type N-terminal cleavage/methylation domain-containing protein